jgi:hypothetical protein
MTQTLKAPFPWFGGKSRVAHVVWSRFGDVPNYVEPFAGSLAVLLARPTPPRIETVNDIDCMLSNFWRAVSADPASVAKWADWPVNEADLHARHLWLVQREEFRERMKTEPEFFDPKIAGWWVWGLSQWIGGGWCGPSTKQDRADGSPRQGRPFLSEAGQGIHRKIAYLRGAGNGVHRKRNSLKRSGTGVHRQLPDISGNGGATGLGIHCARLRALTEYFEALCTRLRRVRVCCGNWDRVLGPSPTFHIGLTGVFLDPPYSSEADRDPDLYACEDSKVAHRAREWAIANAEHPKLRIALCGYAGEHEMPPPWECFAWKSAGGYAVAGGRGKANRDRERIWFSPNCLRPQENPELFDHRV